ncbi:ABC transporter substrate-binding protein [Azospirillum picis]|uniref:Spermidine/putrescine transport system substrate-binding protein n=1 Tax=Azospirillum picis TaxID=488438 RepID=A0ABU0MUB8_9PROT|nr:ABC transporter substrate-binding protein [Azospirillum picis]MBP2299141.1 putative spermidine/putrescine transport system substrate-binding protein [Azospirillum picis]MDQ0537067.1 putative spermidine/putrescine transport system substrate-binding protein [Azospirillum picis]
MSKFKVALGFVATFTAVSALASVASARDLTVVSWGGAYQDVQKKVYFEPFKATGTPMNDESWDGGVGVLRAKVQGGASTWDVVQVESEELALGCDEGLYEKMNFSRIGGEDSYLPATVNPCGVGAIVYDFVLGYDKDKLKDAPKSWADFFDTKKYPGKRGLRQGAKTTLEIALMADGVAPSDVYKTLSTEAGIDRAFKKLDTIKNDIVWWKAGAQPPQLLASGEVVMTSVYNGRIDAANKNEKKNFGMVWNGALYTIDSWVILKGSPNVDAAYKFLDFVGKAENQAKLSQGIAYGTSNKKAPSLLQKAELADLPTAPDNMKTAIEINTDFWLENIDRLTERFNKWAAK